LIRGGVSIYSPHTGFDSAHQGINQTLGERIGLTNIAPLIANVENPEGPGAGRFGELSQSMSLKEIANIIKSRFSLEQVQIVGAPSDSSHRIAVACGSGGSFLDKAIANRCDTFVTGEATFHTCLEAKANNLSVILLGHYASERFAVDDLAARIEKEFEEPGNARFKVWASQEESDPLAWI
jgi:dinuclear metal center YbgI/SA1388 family protein